MLGLSEGMRIKVNLVAFLVLSLGLSYGMATKVLSVLQDRYSVYGIFDDAGGVFTDQEVTYRGVTVGSVGKMEVIPEGVRIEIQINQETKVPAEDVVARVMFKSAVGEQFIDLLPATEGEPYLEDGDVIPNERTEIPVQTQELLSTLEAVLRGVPPEDLEGAIDALGEGLTGRGPDIATLLESLADISEVFAARAPEVEGILRNGTKFGGAFLRSRQDFARALDQLVIVSRTLADNTGNLERLMKGSNLTADEGVALIREYRAAINRFLIEFAQVNDLQAEHAGDLGRIFEHLPTALARLNRTFERKTGLVRFGFIGEPASAACSYVTDRRSPTNRKPQLPPKNARCGEDPSSRASSRQASPTPRSAPHESSASPHSLLDGLDASLDAGVPELPARMRDWSWLLFYIRPLTL